MSFQFCSKLKKPSHRLWSCVSVNSISPFRWSRYEYQMQSENARQMLIRKDGIEMSTHEIQSLFQNMGAILNEVAKDAKGYKPTDLDGTETLMSDLRQVRLEYAPAQLRFLSSNFMIWYHGYTAKRIYENLHFISTTSNEKENEFNLFSLQLLAWNKYLNDDMDIVWYLLEDIDIKILQKEGEIEDEEDMMKIIRNLRINCSLYLNNYEKYLLQSYQDIMEYSKSITFLEFDEAELALTASPFLGKFDVMCSLIDRLTQEKAKQCKKNPEILIEKVLDLPSGLNWFNLYKMYKDGHMHKNRQIIEDWESEKDLFYEANIESQTRRNVNDLCWFKMDNFESKILNICIGDNEETDWSWIKEKYLDIEHNKQCDIITENNSLIHKMGNICEIICLLGSKESIFGENILHLTGLWLSNFNNINGDGDRILVEGKNILKMTHADHNEAYLVHEESWDLFQQYSIDKNNIFVAGICATKQQIQSHRGEKLNIANIPNVISLQTQIQMTLTKQCPKR